jgi:polysaccharide biosynthesis protein PslJ
MPTAEQAAAIQPGQRSGQSSASRAAVRPLRPWPVLALFWGFPLWWALGLGVLIFPLLAVPMVWQLWRHGDVRVPPLFGWWLLFLAWQLWGLFTLYVNDPTLYVAGSTVGRMPAWTLRVGSLAAVTVLAVFVWNLDSRVFGPRRLLNCLAWLCGVTIVGGYVGTAYPTLEFTGALEYIVPAGLREQAYVSSLIHPSVAQITDVLGFDAPRPKAPFEYTNTWGNNLAVLLVLLLPWAAAGGPRRRAIAGVMAGLAVVPIILSLNRGVWLGLALVVVFLAATFARQRRPAAAIAVGATALLLGAALTLTPLGTTLAERATHGHSDVTRSNIAGGSLEVSLDSPVVGLGSARTANGGSASLGAGRSPACPQCATVIYGSNGFLWTTLVTTGLVGAAIYVSWLGAILWRTRRYTGILSSSARAVVVLALFFSLFYDHFPSPMAIFWMAIVLLWRSQPDRADV